MPLGVDDAVQVKVAHIALAAEVRLEPGDSALEQLRAGCPGHGGAHLAGHGTQVTREEPFVFEVDGDRLDEVLPVEERADGHLDPTHPPLQLHALQEMAPDGAISLKYAHHVPAV